MFIEFQYFLVLCENICVPLGKYLQCSYALLSIKKRFSEISKQTFGFLRVFFFSTEYTLLVVISVNTSLSYSLRRPLFMRFSCLSVVVTASLKT